MKSYMTSKPNILGSSRETELVRYKEFACAIMNAEKTHNLPYASCRPGKLIT